MAAPLDPASRAKLVGILGMLGSDFDGERASAGLLATRLLKDCGLRWEDVIPPAVCFAGEQSSGGNRSNLTLCLHHLGQLTEWECGFVQSVASRGQMSPKQVDVLARIAGALRTRGFR